MVAAKKYIWARTANCIELLPAVAPGSLTKCSVAGVPISEITPRDARSGDVDRPPLGKR